MSKTYLVTLKPIDKFFFGGDMTFAIPEGNKERKEANRSFSSYIIRSMPFPQQTSLLGMLRFLLLRKRSSGSLYCDSCNDRKLQDLRRNGSKAVFQ